MLQGHQGQMTSNFRDCEIYQIWIIRGSFDIPIKWHLRFCKKKNWNRDSFGHATFKNVKTGCCYVICISRFSRITVSKRLEPKVFAIKSKVIKLYISYFEMIFITHGGICIGSFKQQNLKYRKFKKKRLFLKEELPVSVWLEEITSFWLFFNYQKDIMN